MARIEEVYDSADQEDAGDVVMEDQNVGLFSGGRRVPNINPPPPAKNERKLLPIPETPFSAPYSSSFALKVAATTPRELDCLKHVNCGYLSTAGLPPTLLQLKQHAQSLTVLIKHMTVSTKGSVVDNENITGAGLDRFNTNESFDFLNNLAEPYENDDRHHQMPLTSLINNKGSLPAYQGPWVDMCPMHRADVNAPRNGVSLPYATHQTLIQHANEVLELLDHEYSAKGGLLSILPPQEQEEERKVAETTLLGQLILYIIRLVQRVHDLERQYANTLDVVKGEAAAPRQALSLLGPHGRQPREMVYPQDRFVLVNAGDDVWQYLNNEFQIKEAAADEVELRAREQGVSGEALWKEGQGKDVARGITTLDVMTRYYRLRNDSLDTVFIIPAYHEHPGTRVTRDIESQPTVVSVVKPVWPERASVIEMKHRDDMKELKMLRQKHEVLQLEATNANESMKAVFMDQQLKAQELRELKSKANQDLAVAHMEIQRLTSLLHDPINRSQLKIDEESKAANEAKTKAILAEEEFKQKTLALENELKRAQEKTKASGVQIEKERNKLKLMEETMQSKLDQRRKKLDERDADIARTANATNTKLKAIWESQIVEQQILIEYLKRYAPDALRTAQGPSDDDKARGAAIGQRMISNKSHAGVRDVPTARSVETSVSSSGLEGSSVESHADEENPGDVPAASTAAQQLPMNNLGIQWGHHASPKSGLSSPANSGEKIPPKSGTSKGATWTVKKGFRNKNDRVTFDLSDVANVEVVETQFADIEDEGEEEGGEDGDVAMK